MYESFFGLKELPWNVGPDPRFAFRSLSHKLAYGKMKFAADTKAGLAVLNGPIGTGKTTIANMLVADCIEESDKAIAYLPVADDRGRAAFIKRIMDGFGIESDKRNYGDNRTILEQYLIDIYKAGKHAVLVIDEGQKIYAENFDTLVDLTNFQTSTDKFITVIVFAQDNFINKLRTKDAFTSRIAYFAHLDPLSPEDMQGMIAHRLRTAGANIGNRSGATDNLAIAGPLPDLSLFLTDDALIELYRITKGVPRDVCIFLATLFLDTFIRNEKPITKEQVSGTFAEMSRAKKWPVVIKETK